MCVCVVCVFCVCCVCVVCVLCVCCVCVLCVCVLCVCCVCCVCCMDVLYVRVFSADAIFHSSIFLLPFPSSSSPPILPLLLLLPLLQNTDYKLRFTGSQWARIEQELTRERGLWGPERSSPLDKWTLDFIEGLGMSLAMGWTVV